MTVVNSAINTKAFSYKFTRDGALGAGVQVFSGVAFKPGDVILDIRSNSGGMTAAGGTTFSLVFNSGFGALFTDTVASLNSQIFAFYGRHNATAFTFDFSDNFATPVNSGAKLWEPFGLHLDLSVMFTSSAPITSGNANFIITYVDTRF